MPGTLPGGIELVGSGRGLSGKLPCLMSFKWSGGDERVILHNICQRDHIEESAQRGARQRQFCIKRSIASY